MKHLAQKKNSQSQTLGSNDGFFWGLPSRKNEKNGWKTTSREAYETFDSQHLGTIS
jgi:hypothetical protein